MEELPSVLTKLIDECLIDCVCCRKKYTLLDGIIINEHFVCETCILQAGIFLLSKKFNFIPLNKE